MAWLIASVSSVLPSPVAPKSLTLKTPVPTPIGVLGEPAGSPSALAAHTIMPNVSPTPKTTTVCDSFRQQSRQNLFVFFTFPQKLRLNK
jgi:hypothetical protein